MLLKGTREELIALVERIRRCAEPSEAAQSALLEQFCASVTHPGASGLIYYPDRYFGKGYEPTSAEIVDKAIGHRAIQMPGTVEPSS